MPTIKQLYFTSGNQTVESKVIDNYFATSDSVQQPQRCVEFLRATPIGAISEGANFMIEEVYNIITSDYYRDV